MDFLAKKRKGDPPPVAVVFGDDDFLRRQASVALRDWAVGPDPDDFTYSEYAGDTSRLRDVLDDLFTPPFIGDRRLALVEQADKFITNFREPLLDYVQAPSSCGVLLLEARSWMATTKLAKAVEESGLAIECKAPAAWHVPAWVSQWASSRHGKRIDKATAEWLVELVGPSLGQLDQELAKLATFVGGADSIGIDAVNQLVAGTRVETVFKLLDQAIEGSIGQALEQLDRAILAGEQPVGVLAMLTSQLRKLTRAARGVVAGRSMDAALAEAGVPPFAVEKARAHLRHLGRERMRRMLRLLLATDLDLKGNTALSPRVSLERFLVKLARREA